MCGILIENVVVGQDIRTSFIGIGVNVNQTDFDGLPQATSIANALGHGIDRGLFFHDLLRNLESGLETWQDDSFETLKQRFENRLYRCGVPSMYRMPDGRIETGSIRGIDDAGRLRIMFRDGERTFGFKEVEFLMTP